MKKTGLLGVMLLFLVSLYGCATAVSSGYGQEGMDEDGRSFSESRADNRITSAVIIRLVEDKRVPAIDIDVKTYNGVVTLSGSVPSRAAARYAEALAASVDGVVRVNNRLRFGQ